jgi:hypothetical protein
MKKYDISKKRHGQRRWMGLDVPPQVPAREIGGPVNPDPFLAIGNAVPAERRFN